MSKKNPNDRYGYPEGEDTERERPDEERTHTFDEEYYAPDAAPVPEPPEPPAERGLTAEPRREIVDVKKLSRKEKKALAAMPEKALRESPVMDRKVRSGKMLVYDSELDEVDYTDPDDLPEARDYLPIRFRRYGRLGIGGGVLYALFVISVSIVLACFAWMCAVDVLALNKEEASAIVTVLPYEPTGDMPATVTREDENGDPVEVPIKVDIDQVADALKSGGIIEYKWLFKLFSSFSHANIKIDPGTYDLNTSYDYRALVTKMQFGSDSQEITQVTFPEGFTMEQIFTLLEQNFVCEKKELYEAAANYDFNYDFLADIPLGDASRLEGFLFPDTYEFYQGESATVAISRFLDNTENKLTQEILDKAANHGLNVQQLLTMASLIEKEAGGAEGERENMASAIYNRLAAGMPLQIDATVNYALGTSTLALTHDDLQVDSPYNTYLYGGLPPGPICNPGLASIKAVAEPADTGYYYWYSVDGATHFFATNDEHAAFAAANPN